MSLIIYRKAYTPYKEKNKKYIRRNLEKRNVCKKQILRFFTIPSFGEVMTNDAIYYSIGSLTNTISATSIRIRLHVRNMPRSFVMRRYC